MNNIISRESSKIDSFDVDRIRYQIVAATATREGTSIAQVLCREGLFKELSNYDNWGEPYQEQAEEDEYSSLSIIENCGVNPLTDYCKEIAEIIQFPVNTTTLHGIGIVSSAMNLKFKYDYNGTPKPANLYIVTAQPPSTGKSGVNEKLTNPVRSAYAQISKTNRIYQAESNQKIKKLENELATQTSETAIQNTSELIEREKEFLASKPNYTYSVDDSTPEALEDLAGAQGGLFNVISAEADAINVLLGSVYNDTKRGGKANQNLFLKGWDFEHLSSARISRDATSTKVFGSIVVIAQDSSIDSILEAGKSGRGIAERILMLREKPKLGTRNHKQRKTISSKKKEAYIKLIDNIVEEQEEVLLTVAPAAMDAINVYRNEIEPHMKAGGKFSNNLIVGVAGKADKQILKLASVLHVCEQWSGKIPKRKTEIKLPTVERAINIFKMLIETFIEAADAKGFTGQQTELRVIAEYLEKRNNNAKHTKKSMTVKQLVDILKKKPEFKGANRLTMRFKEVYLPILIKRNILAWHENLIYYNPKL